MRSIRFKILFWCFSIVIGSVLAIIWVALSQGSSKTGPRNQLIHLAGLQGEIAESLRNREELRSFLMRMDRTFGGRHILTNREGLDRITGADHSALLREVSGAPDRMIAVGLKGVLVSPTPSGHSFWIVERAAPLELLPHLPYALLIAGAMALFCSILAYDIAMPLKRLADGVSRFGAGHLDTRVHVPRNDEIGSVGRAFDQMATRIQSTIRAERQLLQDISHELRSPLARISLATQLAKFESSRDEALLQLEREVERLVEIARDLVAVVKAEGDISTNRTQWLRLDRLVDEVAETCRLEAHTKEVSIDVRNDAGPVPLEANPQLLWRVFENVLRNAILHGAAGTAILVSIAACGQSEVEVAIRDHGPGLAEEDLEAIFRPFHRADPSRSADTGGVGLGLSIAKRAVMVHHGAISAENAKPGLRVRIRLPLTVRR
jgi:two-component system sensor histidine kinase CpxA